MRVGTFVLPGQEGTLDELIARLVRAEADGFASVWLPNTSTFDAIMALSLAARETASIELGTLVVPTYPRHPVSLAQQALTASAASNGRFTLGIGLSHRVMIENSLGLDFSKPIRHTREYLSVLMPLLDGRPAAFAGEEYRVNAQLRFPGAPCPDVIVAALGPQMLRLAGRLADGTGIWMGGPKYLEKTAIPIITAAAREAGRPAPRVVAAFPVAVTANVGAARAVASKSLAVYGQLPSYRAILDVEGAADASGVIIAGSEAEVERKVHHLADIGVTDFCGAPLPMPDDPGAEARTYAFLASLKI